MAPPPRENPGSATAHHLLMYYLPKLHSQTSKISFVIPCHLPQILGQKGKGDHQGDCLPILLQVLMTSLAKEKVSRIDKDNMWLGPREEDLIHVGAKYSPCMREVTYIQIIPVFWALLRGIADCLLANLHLWRLGRILDSL